MQNKSTIDIFSERISTYLSNYIQKITLIKVQGFRKKSQACFNIRIKETSTTQVILFLQVKKSESLQTEGRHFRSMICKINDV